MKSRGRRGVVYSRRKKALVRSRATRRAENREKKLKPKTKIPGVRLGRAKEPQQRQGKDQSEGQIQRVPQNFLPISAGKQEHFHGFCPSSPLVSEPFVRATKASSRFPWPDRRISASAVPWAVRRPRDRMPMESARA